MVMGGVVNLEGEKQKKVNLENRRHLRNGCRAGQKCRKNYGWWPFRKEKNKF